MQCFSPPNPWERAGLDKVKNGAADVSLSAAPDINNSDYEFTPQTP